MDVTLGGRTRPAPPTKRGRWADASVSALWAPSGCVVSVVGAQDDIGLTLQNHGAVTLQIEQFVVEPCSRALPLARPDVVLACAWTSNASVMTAGGEWAVEPHGAFEVVLRAADLRGPSGHREGAYDFRCRVDLVGYRRPLYSRVLTLH